MLNVTLAFGLSDIGGGEILVIGLIALLLFGKNLPTVMKNLGKAYGQFKTTLNAASSEFKKEIDIAAEELEKAKRDVDVKKELSAVTNEINSSLNDEPEPSITPQVDYTETPALTDTTQAKPRPAPPDSIDQSPSSLDTLSSGSATATAPKAAPSVVAEAPKSANPTSLDQLQKNIAPPKKIPPPI